MGISGTLFVQGKRINGKGQG